MTNSKKILLVYPGKQGATFPELPLPILYLSYALREAGFFPHVLDMRLDDYKLVCPQDYLFIGVSVLTGPPIKYGLQFAKFVKNICPEVPIVWGGIHTSLLPEQTLKSDLVDYVVFGEGEDTIKELAITLSNKGDVSCIKGIGYKTDGKTCVNEAREFIDFTKIPKELPYELFQMDRYVIDIFPIHSSRGCPYRCSFCYSLVFNKRRWRAKSAVTVLDEIEYVINKFGVSHISFTWEDEFFIDKDRVKDICEGILERNINIKWDAFCRFNHFYKFEEDYIRLLERSGCASLSFGGESGSQRMLDDIITKDVVVEQMIITAKKLAKTKICQIVSFISGLPEETDRDMDLTFKLMDKLYEINPNIYLNGLFLYTPYPGTKLFELVATKYNYQIPDSLEAWANFGIFRNVGATWQTEDYMKKYKTVSILTRFPFYRNQFRLKDIGTVIGGGRFDKFPYNIIYYVFTSLARWRWKKKYFKFPIEWWLLEKIMERYRGFI